MRIRYHNWSGHGNLGDDEMDRLLKEHIGGEIVEKDWDWQIVGGGTIIGAGSEFIRDIKDPDHTIIFGAGVYADWDGLAHREQLIQVRKIFVRDMYSHFRLNETHLDSTLSFDPWFLLESRKWQPGEKVMANIVNCPDSPVMGFHKARELTEQRLRERDDVDYFAVSSQEDMRSMKHPKLYTDGQTLIDDLSHAKHAYTTRLHATVAAWMAGVRDIRPLTYDWKIQHFLEYARLYEPEYAKQVVLSHIQEVKNIIGL